MIRTAIALIVLLLLWSGYWAGAGFGVRQSLTDWFAARERDGWRAEFADISTSGYPARHETRLESPALADPETGAAWQADWIAFSSPAAWPGHVTVMFPQTPQLLSYFDQSVALLAEGMAAELRLHPGRSLQLETMALTAGPWRVDGQHGAEMEARTLLAAVHQTGPSERYRFEVEAQDFGLGPRVRQLLARGNRLPDDFEALRLDMTVLFDRPWDRRSLEERRPQPTRIDLKRADVQWGALRFLATGSVTVDPDGVPDGAVSLRAENWRDMLMIAEAVGAVPAAVAAPAEAVLSMLAGLSGNPDTVDINLVFADGVVLLGPLSLGPAPRLILR